MIGHILLLTGVLGFGGSTDTPIILATSGDTNVLREDLNGRGAEDLEALLDELVAAVQARELGLHERPQVAELIDSAVRTLARQAFERFEFQPEPSEEELVETYKRSRDSAVLGLIQTRTKEEAEEARRRLLAGEAYGEVAKAHDILHNQAARHITREMTPPELQDIVFSIPLNEVSEALKGAVGFSVLVVTERTLADMAGFEAQRAQVRERLGEARRQAMLKHFVDKRRAAMGIEFDDAFLDSAGPRLEIPGEEARVLVKVGARTVTYGELIFEMRRVFGGRQSTHLSGPRVKMEIVRRLADRIILADEAIAKGYHERPAVAARAAAQRRRVLSGALREELAAQLPPPDDALVERYFAENRDRFRPPKIFTIRHVLVATQATADEVLTQLASGIGLDELALRHSTDSISRGNGGRLDPIGEAQLRGVDPALYEAVVALEVGEVSGVVPTRFGFHVVRLERRVWPATPPLPRIRDRVVPQALQDARRRAYEDRVRGARASVAIELDAEQLRGAGLEAPEWVKKAP